MYYTKIKCATMCRRKRQRASRCSLYGRKIRLTRYILFKKKSSVINLQNKMNQYKVYPLRRPA